MTDQHALIRVAGLPMSMWLAGSSPDVFDQLAELATRSIDRDTAAQTLADRLGADLVPDLRLTGRQRATVLALRRTLHSADRAPGVELLEVRELADRLGRHELAVELAELGSLDKQLAAAESAAKQVVQAADHQLRERIWPLITDSQIGYRAIAEANAETLADIRRRVACGEPWTSKRMRQRADYLWRMVSRGAVRSTPRGWLAQVAVVQLSPTADTHRVTLLDSYATEQVDNIHDRRRGGDQLGPQALLNIAPLHWRDADQLQFWIRDHEAGTVLSSIRLRATPPLLAVCRVLSRGTVSYAELMDVLTSGAQPAAGALQGFVEYLCGIGIIEISAAPVRVLSGWASTAELPAHTSTSDYLDVYRRTDPRSNPVGIQDLGTLTANALRVLQVVQGDGGYGSLRRPGSDLVGADPRPLLDVVAADLDRQRPQHLHRHDWPTPAPDSAGSDYGRLVEWLDERRHGDEPVDLDLAPVLAESSAPELDWPLDCLLRPIHDGDHAARAVLDRFEPAGILDARFADAMSDLRLGATRVQSYRAFLDEVEAISGGRFVELLVPPLSGAAANAVRRPGYTSSWTGDAAVGHYCQGQQAPVDYLPLGEITLRRVAGRLQAEARGQLIWVTQHATRKLPQPWDVVAGWLASASLQPSRSAWPSLAWSLAGWPDRDRMPRITVGAGALVLSPAQWRLSLPQLWNPADSMLAKCRALETLQSKRGLPRWIQVTDDVHADSTPCDLHSLNTVRVIDRLIRRGASSLLVAELLPNPEQLTVIDSAHPDRGASAAEWLVRLPLDGTVAPLAARAVQQWQRRSTTTVAIGLAATARA